MNLMQYCENCEILLNIVLTRSHLHHMHSEITCNHIDSHLHHMYSEITCNHIDSHLHHMYSEITCNHIDSHLHHMYSEITCNHIDSHLQLHAFRLTCAHLYTFWMPSISTKSTPSCHLRMSCPFQYCDLFFRC